jgi:RNAse (barnase) inhibitor barstar
MQCNYCNKNKDNLIHFISENFSICEDCRKNLQVRWDEYVSNPLEACGTYNNKQK